MAIAAMALVEGIRRISNAESTQTRLGLIVVGFATAFELVVLAWSSARRGITAAVVAGVIGSVTYNVTMTLGAGALSRPLRIEDPGALRGPWLGMLAALALVVVLRGTPRSWNGEPAGFSCFSIQCSSSRSSHSDAYVTYDRRRPSGRTFRTTEENQSAPSRRFSAVQRGSGNRNDPRRAPVGL